MVARAHYQDHWVLNLYRATQAAIGQQLKIEYEPPRELTAELTIVLRKLDEPRHERKLSSLSYSCLVVAPASCRWIIA